MERPAASWHDHPVIFSATGLRKVTFPKMSVQTTKFAAVLALECLAGFANWTGNTAHQSSPPLFIG